MRNATHTWVTGGIELDVVCDGGDIFPVGFNRYDPYVAPLATYEVVEYDEEGSEVWAIRVCGQLRPGKLVPISPLTR